MKVLVIVFVGLLDWANSIPLPEDNLFQIIWQAPSNLCTKYDHKDQSKPRKFPFALSEDGLVENPRGRYDGEFSAIFYHYGTFPMYAFSDPSKKANGGIPQRGNLQKHIEKAYKDIEKEIPNDDFGGIACLNQEEWRPLFQQNFGVKAIYQDQSIELVMEQHPELMSNFSAVIEKAMQEYDDASVGWAVASLRFARLMRPNGRWGYYAWPFCYNSKVPVRDACSEGTKETNTKLKPIWDAASALFPSLYIWNKDYSPIDRAKFAFAQTEEGVRCAALADDYTPVYPYTRMLYTTKRVEDRWAPYRKHDLWTTMRMAADFGTDGLIIWGADVEFNDARLCKLSSDYYNEIVGPYAKKIMEFINDCSAQKCSKKGKCIHYGTFDRMNMSRTFRLTEEDFWNFDITDEYMCKCFDGWKGSDCSEEGQQVLVRPVYPPGTVFPGTESPSQAEHDRAIQEAKAKKRKAKRDKRKKKKRRKGRK